MKPETQKAAVFILFLAILSVIIYYLVFNKDKKPKTYIDNSVATNTGANTTGSTGAVTNTALFPLKRGMKSKYVKALQKGLNQKYFAKLDIDGDFGNNTQKAVETYLNPLYKLKPSKVGVSWAVFTAQGFDKLV